MAEMTTEQLEDLTKRIMGETARAIWKLVDEEFLKMADALDKAASLPNAGEAAVGLSMAARSLRSSANHASREGVSAENLLGTLS